MSTVLNDEAIARARQALRAGQPAQAEKILLANAAQTHLAARDYDEVLRTLAEALVQQGNLRAAGTVWLYLRESGRMAPLVTNEPRDLARASQLDRRHALAAQHYRAARWPAHAAIQFEEAQEYPAARALWAARIRRPPTHARRMRFVSWLRVIGRPADDLIRAALAQLASSSNSPGQLQCAEDLLLALPRPLDARLGAAVAPFLMSQTPRLRELADIALRDP